MDMQIGDVRHGFRLLSAASVPHMGAQVWTYVHEASGATLYYSDRDDGQLVFGIAFRTIPEDDTGVFHILEHSCLDGSEKYPLKEPFVNLMKTSMSVDLNACTYPDKTLYYFASTGETDYANMLAVYLDAVFHPLLLSDRRIFEKEAWHLEPAEDGGVTCTGVVYNEMQGHENNPARILYHEASRCLYPDRYDRYDAGGDPSAIPTLTYERFKNTYRRFYRADNATVYVSGKLSLDAVLAQIDASLCGCAPTEGDAPSVVPSGRPVICPMREVAYQIGDNEPTESATQALFACAVGQGETEEEALALAILGRYLAENTESPLSRAVLASGVGQDFRMTCDGSGLQPIVYFKLGKTDPERVEDFRRTVLDETARLVRDGFDQARLCALVDDHEVTCRRQSLEVDTGLRLMEAILSEHVTYGRLKLTDHLAVIRRKMAENPRYFESLAEAWILQSEHWALVRCVPSRTLSAERRARTDAWLAEEAATLRATEGAYEDMARHTESLHEYLLAEDSPEAEATVPHLTPADIVIGEDKRDMEVSTARIGGDADAVSLLYEAQTSGIVSASLLFDMSGMTEEDLFYVRCLLGALPTLPTKRHTVEWLTDRWVELHSSISVGLRPAIRGCDADDTAYYLQIYLDTLDEHLEDATRLLGEYLSETVFDRGVLQRRFSNAQGFKNALVRSGNATAIYVAESALSAAGACRMQVSGVDAYRSMARLADDFDGNADDLVAGLERVSRHLFDTVSPIAAFTGSREAYDVWRRVLAELPIAGNVRQTAPTSIRPVERAHRALTVPGEVSYCAEAFRLSDVGAAFSPRMLVAASYLNTTYFWDEIRAKGGAYGAGVSVMHYGILAFSSYRDPRVAETYEVFSRLPDWLDAHLPSADTLDGLVVSTLASAYFTPQSPMDEGASALERYLRGKTAADRRASIESILTTTVEDIRAFGQTVRQLYDRNAAVRATLGNSELVEKSGLFDRIEEL